MNINNVMSIHGIHNVQNIHNIQYAAIRQSSSFQPYCMPQYLATNNGLQLRIQNEPPVRIQNEPCLNITNPMNTNNAITYNIILLPAPSTSTSVPLTSSSSSLISSASTPSIIHNQSVNTRICHVPSTSASVSSLAINRNDEKNGPQLTTSKASSPSIPNISQDKKTLIPFIHQSVDPHINQKCINSENPNYKSKMKRSEKKNKQFQCPECNKLFQHEHNLQIHRKMHFEPLKCPYGHCDKQFARKANLIQHIRIHTNDRPWNCKTCHKCFRQKKWYVLYENKNRFVV